MSACPIEPNIPIYLAVAGGFSLVELLSLQWRRRKKSRGDAGSSIGGSSSYDVLDAALSMMFGEVLVVSFLLAWLGCGTYWAARVFKPLFGPTPDKPTLWCSETAYTLALVQIVSCYAVLFAVIIAVLLLMVHHLLSD